MTKIPRLIPIRASGPDLARPSTLWAHQSRGGTGDARKGLDDFEEGILLDIQSSWGIWDVP